MYVEAFCKRVQKGLLKKAMKWFFCISTTPVAAPDALVSGMKGSVKSRGARIWALDMVHLRASKA